MQIPLLKERCKNPFVAALSEPQAAANFSFHWPAKTRRPPHMPAQQQASAPHFPDWPAPAGHAQAASHYSMLDLTLPGGSHSHGYGINASGQVVGQSQTSFGEHAFFMMPARSLPMDTTSSDKLAPASDPGAAASRLGAAARRSGPARRRGPPWGAGRLVKRPTRAHQQPGRWGSSAAYPREASQQLRDPSPATFLQFFQQRRLLAQGVERDGALLIQRWAKRSVPTRKVAAHRAGTA